MGTTTVSLLGSFLGAGGVGLLKLRSASLLAVCRSAKSASELLAEANMSEKLGVAELLGCGDGDRPRSLGVAVMGAAHQSSCVQTRLASTGRNGSQRGQAQFLCQRAWCP